MCELLEISRTVYYYKRKTKVINTVLENQIIKIFKDSRNNYGTRKIKVELKRLNIIASRRKNSPNHGQIWPCIKLYCETIKVHKTSCNNDNIGNKVNRKFNNRTEREVVVSDLTYVNVDGKWNYICL